MFIVLKKLLHLENLPPFLHLISIFTFSFLIFLAQLKLSTPSKVVFVLDFKVY